MHSLRKRLLVGATALGILLSVAVASPAAAVPSLTVVSVTRNGSLLDPPAGAACPAFTKVLGGGGRITGVSGDVRLYLLKPYIDNGVHKFLAAGIGNVDDWGDNWTITTWAICAAGITGHEIVEATAVNSGPGLSNVTVTCPAGKKVIGAGGLVSKGGLVLDDVAPSSTLSSVSVQGMALDTAPGSYSETKAWAVCIDPLPGQQLVTATTATSSENKSAVAACPAGTRVHGTGARMTLANGEALLRQVGFEGRIAAGGPTQVTVDAVEDPTGHGGAWALSAYAICAN